MSQPETQQTRQQLRRTIRTITERHDTITVAEVVSNAAVATGADEADVVNVLDELERHGFVYLVGDSDVPGEKEVRVP